MKFVQIVIGAVIVALGLMMLVVMLRADPSANANPSGQSIIAPLSLIGAGALAISAAQKRKK